MKVIQNVYANRVESAQIAKQDGGRLPSVLALDNHLNVGGNKGAFFARQFALCIPAKSKDAGKKQVLDDESQLIMPAAPEIVLVKGQDFHCKRSNIVIPASELALFDIVVKNGVFGRHDFFALLDPEAVTFENGAYVLQNPSIELVENAVTVFGGRGRLDPMTGVALKDEIKALDLLDDSEKRWNFTLPGVWPITQGIYSYFYYPRQREIQGFTSMGNRLTQVLVESRAD